MFRVPAALLLLLALAAASGCFGPKPVAVRLGFVATFSGEGFRSGRNALEAARFAVETARRAGTPQVGGLPCQVSLVVRDDKASAEEAARVVRELAEKEHVTAIIGPFPSGLADAAALAAEAARVPLVAPSATAEVVTAGRPHIFRIAFTDAFQGAVLGRMAARDLGLRRVAIIANQDSLSSQSLARAFAKAFAECGGTAGLFTYPDRSRDFRELMEEALAGAPQALFLPNHTQEAMLQALAARKAGFTGTLLGGDAWDGSAVSRLRAFLGAYFVDHWREDAPGQASRDYVAAFRQARKRPVTELGALTQDAVGAVLAAVQRAGSADPQAVTRALASLPPYDGVTGRFNFENDGDPIKSLFITRIDKEGAQLETMVVPPPEPCR